MAQRVLILGASARAAAYSARRAGLAPYAIDLFADADLRAACPALQVRQYPDELAEFAARVPAMPWIYTGGLENYPRLVDRIAATRPLLGNAGPVLRGVRDVERLAAILDRQGFSFPESTAVPPTAQQSGSWLRKARRSSGGQGVAVWSGDAPIGKGDYFQRQIEGQPCAAVFVAAAGKAVLLGLTQQLCGTAWTGAAPFHYAGSIGPMALPPAALAEVRRLGEVLAGEFTLSGLFGVDGIWDGGRFWTLEVNPRYPASVEVLERATHLPALALHVSACRDGQLPPELPIRATRCCGKAILFARTALPACDAIWEPVLEQQRETPWPEVADIPPPGTPIAAGAPIATLFAEGATVEDMETRLQTLAARWHAKLSEPLP